MSEVVLIVFLNSLSLKWWMGGVLMLIYGVYAFVLLQGVGEEEDDEEDGGDDGVEKTDNPMKDDDDAEKGGEDGEDGGEGGDSNLLMAIVTVDVNQLMRGCALARCCCLTLHLSHHQALPGAPRRGATPLCAAAHTRGTWPATA